MMNNQKIKTDHLQRTAYIYIRQSTAARSNLIENPLKGSTNSRTEQLIWAGQNDKFE